MKFLLDENLPPALTIFLKRLGHDALHIRELGLKGAENGVVFKKSLEEERILITADEDFTDTKRYPPKVGIIILMFHPRTRKEIEKQLLRLLKEKTVSDRLKQTLIIIRKDTIEIKKL